MNNLVSKYGVWTPLLFLREKQLWEKLRIYKRSQFLSRDLLEREQFQQFQKTLAYAYDNISFYKNKYEGAMVHPDDIKTRDDINMVPILTKNDIHEAASSIYNSAYSGKKYRRATSGSTGRPLIFYKEPLSMAIMDAILYRNYSWFGIDIGDRQTRFWGHPLNRFGMFKTRILDYMLNRSRLSPFKLDGKAFNEYYQSILRSKPQYIYGYAQSIYQFARYVTEKKLDLSSLKLKAVILTGEMIFAAQVKIIQQAFHCPVTEEYGCTEIGVIGFKCELNHMHIMENLLVESIDRDENNVGNIIVSELYGNYFPFIRYQVGDKGSINLDYCKCGRELNLLDNLSGRKDDFIQCPDGKKVDPYLLEYIINEIPKQFGKVFQFRIIQTALHSLDIYLIATGDLFKLENYIKKELNPIFDNTIDINIKFVSKLEKELSGKLRCFVSNIEQTTH